MSKFAGVLKNAKRYDSAESESVPTREMQHLPERVGKRGRPSGKRSDPAFFQTTSYIRKATYHDVKIRLLQEGQGREFSELVEELLQNWLKS